MKKPFIFALLIIWAVPVFAQVDTAWVRRYNGPAPGSDLPSAIAVDNEGNVYVAGTSWGGWSSLGGPADDFCTIKYDSSGNELWVQRYNGPASRDDGACALAVDSSGNVYVTGFSYDSVTYSDYVTIKYYPNGDTAWVRRYNGPGDGTDITAGLAIDGSGNVYVTGTSTTGGVNSHDYATIKYYSNGDTAWLRRYNGPINSVDQATDIAVDEAGNVYVAGVSSDSCSDYPGVCGDFATIKYFPNGDTAWVRRIDAFASYDLVVSLAVDASGNVYVTGFGYWYGQEFGGGYITVKYYPSGDTAWVRLYAGTVSDDCRYPRDIAVDGSGNVHVTGEGFSAAGKGDYTTVKYYPNGDTAWVRRYDGPPTGGNDEPSAIAVDYLGNVYVTGYSTMPKVGPLKDHDYATVKYDSSGRQVWVKTYQGRTGTIDSYDHATAIAVNGSGCVYITGTSRDVGAGYDYATIKYVQDNQPPTFTVGILQNPIFSAELNIYTIASESLKTAPTMTIGSDTLAVDEIYYDGTTIYSSYYRLTTSGNVEIKVAGTDFGNNVGYHTETFAAGTIYPSGGCVVSHDNVLHLEVGGGAVSKKEYFLVFITDSRCGKDDKLESYLRTHHLLQPTLSWDRTDEDIVSVAYSITPSQLKLKSEAKLSFSYVAVDLERREPGRLTIHRLDGDAWRAIPSYLDSDKHQVVAFIDELGIYQLRYGTLQGSGIVPTTYVLKNNYPNPFNNTTNIRYEISSAGWVKIEIYNTLGQRVRTLVNEHMPAGRYIVDWNGTNERDQTVSSGIYFYTLKINDFTETKKMVFLK